MAEADEENTHLYTETSKREFKTRFKESLIDLVKESIFETLKSASKNI